MVCLTQAANKLIPDLHATYKEFGRLIRKILHRNPISIMATYAKSGTTWMQQIVAQWLQHGSSGG